ncbi:MAG: MarR family transcriptional regulator [Paracoccaceae bacterium]|jgi:DNA-binding MarR family transcriptional regulator|nr:MAG: MarR family transcriptional regulator [Paracoccaceae bacterium]|tara:strand:- start:132 stop:584 length:453 start_codon:yes stop_codon:yes gene_type:complete
MLEFNNKDMNLLILLSEIATIEQLARNKLDNALPKDLNISSFSVLNHFSGSRAEKTPLQLARSFHVTKGAMTNTLNKLEKQGYIHVRPDWNDARKKCVSISQSGIDARNNAMKSIKPILDEIIQKTNHMTKKSLLGDLRNFREAIENDKV